MINADKVRWHITLSLILKSHSSEEASPEPKRKRVENVGCCEKCGVSFAKLLKRKVQTILLYYLYIPISFVIPYLA